MKHIFDLVILVAISVWVIMIEPTLGILFLLTNLIFGTQYWKTLLLIGSHTEGEGTAKRIKAGLLAVLFSTILFFIVNEEATAPQTVSVSTLWNGDFFPIILAVGFLASLLMVALVTEKRKR